MVLVIIILFFTSIRSLQSWDITDNDKYDLLRSWGIKRSPAVGEKIKSKFPEIVRPSCNALHKTEDAPFMAIILYKTSGRLLCLGSIVDQLHILTSKRCYEKTEINDLRVLVGFSKAWWGEFAQIMKVVKILRHEYEVAILKLKSKIKYTEYVQAVRLPSSVTKMAKEYQKVFAPPYQVVGFFVDRFDVPGDFIDKDKRYHLKEDRFIFFDDCKINYTKLVLDKMKLFCVLGNATYCWGGWGAPVLKWLNNYFLQVGIVIADNCTAETTGPFLVARTDVYADWIRGNCFYGHQPR